MRKKLQTAFSTRQYMVSRDFELYYYDDTHFSSVQNHTHNYYEFYFFLDGKVTMIIDGQPHQLQPGDVIVIPPEVPHHVFSPDPDVPYRRFIFWISREYCDFFHNSSPDYLYIIRRSQEKKHYIYHYDMIAFNALQAKLFHIIEELHSDRFGKNTQLSLCVSDLLFHLSRSIYETDHPGKPKEPQSLYTNLLQYIESHLEEELSLEELSGKFFVNKYHIAHIFKENMGISIHQYITKKRLALCRDAILGSDSISKAYLMCGFKDYSSFFRAFKKEYGISPKEFRDQYIHSPGLQSDSTAN
ncbi:MAG: helix-turn-helix domain-containing protein [Lachnospiraceae bacterium]|nr:helix-turn-helix domain-containing protein [Lachnospiraceae bacterium]